MMRWLLLLGVGCCLVVACSTTDVERFLTVFDEHVPTVVLPDDDPVPTGVPVDWLALGATVAATIGTYTLGHRFAVVRGALDLLKGKPKTKV